MSKQKLNRKKKKSHPLKHPSQNPFEKTFHLRRGNRSTEALPFTKPTPDPAHSSQVTSFHRWYHHNAISRHRTFDNDSPSEKEDTISPYGHRRNPTSVGQHHPPPVLPLCSNRGLIRIDLDRNPWWKRPACPAIHGRM